LEESSDEDSLEMTNDEFFAEFGGKDEDDERHSDDSKSTDGFEDSNDENSNNGDEVDGENEFEESFMVYEKDTEKKHVARRDKKKALGNYDNWIRHERQPASVQYLLHAAIGACVVASTWLMLTVFPTSYSNRFISFVVSD
jgi:hypothetical protein